MRHPRTLIKSVGNVVCPNHDPFINCQPSLFCRGIFLLPFFCSFFFLILLHRIFFSFVGMFVEVFLEDRSSRI